MKSYQFFVPRRIVDDNLPGGSRLASANVVLDCGGSAIDVHPAYPDSFVNLGAELVRVLKQQRVELAAINVIGIDLVHARLVTLLETEIRTIDVGVHLAEPFPIVVVNGGVRGRGPARAELVGELRFLHRREEIGIPEHSG